MYLSLLLFLLCTYSTVLPSSSVSVSMGCSVSKNNPCAASATNGDESDDTAHKDSTSKGEASWLSDEGSGLLPNVNPFSPPPY